MAHGFELREESARGVRIRSINVRLRRRHSQKRAPLLLSSPRASTAAAAAVEQLSVFVGA